jgi:hypothetical protein
MPIIRDEIGSRACNASLKDAAIERSVSTCIYDGLFW